MNNYQKDLVEEHSNLVVRINVLHNNVYSSASDVDNKVEFANKCIQLAAMKKYEEALRARLENQGVFFENNQYFKRIGEIKYPSTDRECPKNKDNNEYTYLSSYYKRM